MSRLEELIQKLCPDGVEYKKLNDACIINRGTRVVRNQLKESGQYPVFQNSLTPMGYHDRSNCSANTAFVIVAGAAGDVGYSKVEFWAADDCFYFTCPEILLSRYLYYVLASRQAYLYSRVRKASIPRLARNFIEDLKIPVPPLPVQSEIVRILDNFTELTEELTTKLATELTARKKQYEYYKTRLIEQSENQAIMVSVAELGKWSGGKTPSMANRDFWDNGTIPWISSKDMKAVILEDTEDHITEKALIEGGMTLLPEGVVTLVTRSGILKHTFPIAYVPFRTTVNQDIKALVVRDGVLPKYAFHVLQAYSEDMRVKTKKQGGTVDSLDFQKILDYKIPLPPMDIQKRLINVLDNFEATCSDLNIGLLSEIKSRKKQYKFYRDKLLTFAETCEVITDR